MQRVDKCGAASERLAVGVAEFQRGRRDRNQPIRRRGQLWSNQGDRWIIKTNAILPDSKKLEATNVVTRTGPDTVTWQSKDRTLDGKELPDIKETKLKRVPLNHT